MFASRRKANIKPTSVKYSVSKTFVQPRLPVSNIHEYIACVDEMIRRQRDLFEPENSGPEL